MKLSRKKCANCKYHSGAILNNCAKHNTKNTWYLLCGEFEDKRQTEEILRSVIDNYGVAVVKQLDLF